jgi:hypothetical protein
MKEIDSEQIIQARIRGESVRSIARRLGCTIDDVNDVLDRFASTTLTDKLRMHTLALELERLDGLQEVFEQQAKAGDVQSALLVTKLIERRSVMLGLAAPPRTDNHIIEHARPPAMTSTERIRAAIDRLRLEKQPKADDGSGSDSGAEGEGQAS